MTCVVSDEGGDRAFVNSAFCGNQTRARAASALSTNQAAPPTLPRAGIGRVCTIEPTRKKPTRLAGEGAVGK